MDSQSGEVEVLSRRSGTTLIGAALPSLTLTSRNLIAIKQESSRSVCPAERHKCPTCGCFGDSASFIYEHRWHAALKLVNHLKVHFSEESDGHHPSEGEL